MRSIKDYGIITLKGMAMGAADVVPGVSGGTIALIAGIYKELIDTISSLNIGLLKTAKEDGLVAAFNAVNGKFLVALVAGIGISILSLAKVFNYLLNTHPILVWAFFFGLIVASVGLIGQRVSKWTIGNIVALIIGAAISFGVTIVSPSQGPDTLWYLFLSGVLAFIAMILPGISGSFILLLLGAYHLILEKVSNLLDGIRSIDFTVILTQGIELGIFALGGIVGLMSFSRILKWMFEKYEARTLALLTGFLIGSLNKVWPWKRVEEVFVKHAGEANEKIVPIVEHNVLPGNFTAPVYENGKVIDQIATNPQIGMAIGLAILGFLIIFALERISAKK